MPAWRSALSIRPLVVLLGTAAIVIAVYQSFTLSILQSDVRFLRTVAYSPLALGAYGGVLALFFAWRLHSRQAGGTAGLLLALFALNLSLSVVPSRAAPAWQVIAFSISMLYYLAGLRFTMLFPRAVTLDDLEALRSDGTPRRPRRRIAYGVLRILESLVRRPNRLWALALLFAGLWYVRTAYGAASHYLPFPSPTRTAAVQWVALLVLSPLSFAIGGLCLAFLGCGYQRSDSRERQKILWLVLSILLTVCLVGAWNAFDYLATLWESEWFGAFYSGTVDFVIPVAAFVLLTGFTVSVLYSGAFDVRPLLDKTVLYGVLGVALLFGFGGLEFTLSEVVLDRVGAPSGASSWLAGGAVAIAFGPMRKSFRKRVNQWLRDTLPATTLARGPRRQVAIVFCDIVGYTKLASTNEDDALTMLSIFHRVARKAADKHNGVLVKTMGDGVLMQFKETGAAVAAIRSLSSAFRLALVPLDLPNNQLRTGLHFGLVAAGRDGDLFGDAVNLASRFESIAEPGHIVLSQTAAEHLRDEIELQDLGERTLKNVDQPVKCWSIPA